MKFVLEIEMGNDAMLTKADVANRLRAVAMRIDTNNIGYGVKTILDINGNDIGTFEFQEHSSLELMDELIVSFP
jgi:hypothetical protein